MDSLTLIIVLVAGVVMFFLYKTLREYLSVEENVARFRNEMKKPQIPPVIEPTFQEKVQSSEYGILAGILGYVANADGEICELEKEMASSLLCDMAKEMKNLGSENEVYEELLMIFVSDGKDIEFLTQGFINLTKGEYKKKLKVVEFCFALGYADGELNDLTKEAIVDIGALLGLSNEDFNNLYNDFATSYDVEVSEQEAKEIFGGYDDIYCRYQKLIAQEKQNILEDKNLNKPFGPERLVKLRKIQKSYEILKH